MHNNTDTLDTCPFISDNSIEYEIYYWNRGTYRLLIQLYVPIRYNILVLKNIITFRNDYVSENNFTISMDTIILIYRFL